jgi:flagellar motor switch protein FliM
VQTGDGDDVSDQEWSAELQSAAVDAELEVSVELAQIETTLRQFEAMREGDIVYFNKGEHARLYVNSVPVFDADVGANGSQMAARIIKPLTPVK